MNINHFQQQLLDHNVLDPVGVHHEFAYGSHGRKLDFDTILDSTPLYRQWVDVTAETIQNNYSSLPEAVVGVANGTNRLAKDTAEKLGILALYTQKTNAREVQLTHDSQTMLHHYLNAFVVVIEDVGTTGSTALTAAKSAKSHGAGTITGLFTWQRQSTLPAFDSHAISYKAIISEELPTYSPDECRVHGYCHDQWELIPRKRTK
ncbi:MAG: hypothetical protein NVSMB46_09440 [Candidatus Saccharimonadales bacterium]